MLWNGYFYGTQGDTLLRAYSYSYDAMNRINGSYYGEQYQGALASSNKYREYGNSYDLNGNILSLNRSGNISPLLIDSLQYFYGQGSSYSNKLLKVFDRSFSASGFTDGSNQGDDYE